MTRPAACRVARLFGCLCGLWVTAALQAQQENPVYVDDSPQARELFRQAQDQTQDNITQAVRLYQQLLDDYPRRLIRSDIDGSTIYYSVRSAVLRELRRNDLLLARYREVQIGPADQLLQQDKLAELALSRPLTAPGLTAMLTLGQRELESGDFSGSLFWLDQALIHPDLSDELAAHAWLMVGTSAHYLNDPARFSSALTAVQELGPRFAAFSASLADLQQAGPVAQLPAGISTFDHAPTPNLDEVIGQPIWTAPLSESLLRRRFDGPLDSQVSQEVLDQHIMEADLNTMCPTVAGDIVYINQGHLIKGYNRVTGQEVWEYTDLPKLAINSNETEPVLDTNIISISGNAMVTLTGHALGQSRSHNGTLICINLDTRRPRWLLDRTRLAAAGLEDVFVYGRPVIVNDSVYITARESNRQQLTAEHVLALNLDDGSVRWSQFIASSARLGLPPRSLTSLAVDDGSVYVASMIGAFARIDAGSGLVNWLTTFVVPINAGAADPGRMPWEIAAPILTPEALICTAPDQRSIVSLSRETGEVISSAGFTPAESWNPPRYLLADTDLLYLVGRDVSARPFADISAELWRYPPQQPADPPADPALPALRIAGRVQLSNAALIIPSADGLLFLEPSTGREIRRVALPSTGNPLAIDSQILIAGADRLDSYMPMDLAQRLLRDRIALNPADPQPAMSLMQIARRAHDRALFVQAADLALAALDRMTPADTSTRDALLYLLVEADTPDFTNDIEFGRQLFARMNAVSVEPGQRVEYLLRHADWLAAHWPDQAVEQYQAILSDPVLALSARPLDGALCPARLAATRRLAALIKQQGPALYAAQADFAGRQLRKLLADPAVDPAQLVALACEYPLADAAADAVLNAARLRVAAGQVLPALGDLSTVLDLIPSGPQYARLLSACVQINIDHRLLHDAAAMLSSLRDSDLALTRSNAPVLARQWLTEIERSSEWARLPRLGLNDQPAATIPMQLLPSATGVTGLPCADRFFTVSEDSLHCLDARDCTSRWSVPFTPGAQPVMLGFDSKGSIFWFGSSRKGYAMMVGENGSLLWTSPVADLLLPPSKEQPHDRSAQLPDGRPFDPTRVIPLANAELLILVQASGVATALDRADGRTIRWQRPDLLEHVHSALLCDSLLIIAGRGVPVGADPHTSEPVPMVRVLNARSGETVGDHLPVSDSGVRWMALDPLGRLVLATGENITSLNAYTLLPRWRNTQPAAIESRGAWALNNALVVEDRASGLRTLDWNSGRLSFAFDGPARGEWDPLDVQEIVGVNNAVIARFRQRIVAFDLAGSVIGADVVNHERDYKWLVPAADHLLVISARTEPVQNASPASKYQYVYTIYRFSFNGKLIADPLALKAMLKRVHAVAAVDGNLLLSTQSETIAVPLPQMDSPPPADPARNP